MKNKREINIHSSTAEYLTFIASVGDTDTGIKNGVHYVKSGLRRFGKTVNGQMTDFVV